MLIVSYKRPVSLVLLADILAFGLLFFYREPHDFYILGAGLLVIGLIAGTYLLIVKKGLGDEYLFLIVSMLTSIGFIMIYRLNRELGFKQIIWFFGGIGLFFASYFVYIRIKIWDKLMYVYAFASFGLFLITLVFGSTIKGSTNWIVIKGFSFQPSELIKILFIFTLACYFNHSDQIFLNALTLKLKQIKLKGRIALMVIVYMFMGFLLMQRDWGTALLFFIIYITMMYAFDSNMKFLLLNSLIAALGGVAGYFALYHIRVRVETWLNPWTDISGKGYQITQSLFAIGSGGFFGTGLGMGRPDFIPEVTTDFIFSAICEEMGIFGGVAVVLLYFILAYRGFKIVLNTGDRFKKAVALGITCMFGFQTFIIIGGVIKLIPLTGITLPFISYGGSSLTTSFIALGILQAISKLGDQDGGSIADEREQESH